MEATTPGLLEGIEAGFAKQVGSVLPNLFFFCLSEEACPQDEVEKEGDSPRSQALVSLTEFSSWPVSLKCNTTEQAAGLPKNDTEPLASDSPSLCLSGRGALLGNTTTQHTSDT